MVECVRIFKFYQLQYIPLWQAYLLLLRKQGHVVLILYCEINLFILVIIGPLTNLTIMCDLKVSKIRTHSTMKVWLCFSMQLT